MSNPSNQEFGIKIGNLFLGFTRTKAILPPFESALEEGKPQVITGSTVEDILSAINGKYSDKNLIELFESVPEIFAPIDAWATRVCLGKYGFRKTGSKEVVVDNKDLNKIMNNPNPLQNFKELLYEYVCYSKITGKNFLYTPTPKSLTRMDYKNITGMYNLPSDQTKVKTEDKIKLFSSTEKSDLIKAYIVMEGQENELIITDVDKVLYSAAINMKWKGRKIEGHSPLLSAKKAIQNLVAVYEARQVIYIKRGALGAIISKRSDAGGGVAITNKEKKKILEDIDQLQGVTKGKYPYSVVQTPIDFVRFSMSIQELMPFEETLADTAAIYATLGVPRELMPKNTDSTYANQRDSEKDFIQTRIIPYAEKFCQLMTKFLNLTEAGIEMFVDFSEVPALQENKKEQAEVDKLRTSTNLQKFLNGIITLNQWITGDGGEEQTASVYTKLIYMMSDQELEQVKKIIELQSKTSTKDNQQQQPGNEKTN